MSKNRPAEAETIVKEAASTEGANLGIFNITLKFHNRHGIQKHYNTILENSDIFQLPGIILNVVITEAESNFWFFHIAIRKLFNSLKNMVKWKPTQILSKKVELKKIISGIGLDDETLEFRGNNSLFYSTVIITEPSGNLF